MSYGVSWYEEYKAEETTSAAWRAKALKLEAELNKDEEWLKKNAEEKRVARAKADAKKLRDALRDYDDAKEELKHVSTHENLAWGMFFLGVTMLVVMVLGLFIFREGHLLWLLFGALPLGVCGGLWALVQSDEAKHAKASVRSYERAYHDAVIEAAGE